MHRTDKRIWAAVGRTAVASATALVVLSVGGPVRAGDPDKITIQGIYGTATLSMPAASHQFSVSLAGDFQQSTDNSFDIFNNAGHVSTGANTGVSAPYVTATATSKVDALSFATSKVDYYLVVVGPSTNQVTLDVTGTVNTHTFVPANNLNAFSGDYSRSVANLNITNTYTHIFRQWDCEATQGAGCVSFSNYSVLPVVVPISQAALQNLTGPLDVSAQVLKIEMIANAYADFAGDSASASLDPLITIDPSTPDANLYSIYLSPGYINGVADLSGGSVPEPATWALMIGGFGGLGVAMRRRRSSMLA